MNFISLFVRTYMIQTHYISDSIQNTLKKDLEMSNDIFTAGSLEKGNKSNKREIKINDVIFS